MKIFGLILFIILLIAILLLPIKNKPTYGKLQVTASFYPVYFFASEIAGDSADVKNITPFGAEPHEYEPTARDIAAIEKSNLFIINGGSLETWSKKIIEDLKGKNITVVVASEGLENQQKDPHVWLSPLLAKIEAQTILQGFIKSDPKNKKYYETNAKNLFNKFNELDQTFKNGLSQCSQRDFVTSHAAFGYLAKSYGLNQIAISGISPDEEPSTQKLVEIARFAKEHNVKYIFFEKLISPKLSETIAHEVGAKTLVLDPIEGVSKNDAIASKNYFTIMKDNLNNLRIALKCR